MNATCAGCAHFRSYPPQADDQQRRATRPGVDGFCVRYPPTVVLVPGEKWINQAWPEVSASDRCGEFRPKEWEAAP